MPKQFPRTCPICGRPDLKNISTHLLQVHRLSFEERKPYLKKARVSSWQPSINKSLLNNDKSNQPDMNNGRAGEKPADQSEHNSLPAKKPKVERRRKDYPLCGMKNLLRLSSHLARVHKLSREDRQQYLSQARLNALRNDKKTSIISLSFLYTNGIKFLPLLICHKDTREDYYQFIEILG